MLNWLKRLFTFDKWEWEAGQLLRDNKGTDNCKEQVTTLSNDMIMAQFNHDIVHGTYRGTPHVWIEANGKIYEPSVYADDKSFYRELWREHRNF